MATTRTLTVLIVEDSLDGAETLAHLLADDGHEVRTAVSGEEAVKVWDSFPADVGLPGEDGYAVARKLCAMSERRPLLVMHTGYGNLESRSRAEGIDFHFMKPLDPRILADILSAHAKKLLAAGE